MMGDDGFKEHRQVGVYKQHFFHVLKLLYCGLWKHALKIYLCAGSKKPATQYMFPSTLMKSMLRFSLKGLVPMKAGGSQFSINLGGFRTIFGC